MSSGKRSLYALLFTLSVLVLALDGTGGRAVVFAHRAIAVMLALWLYIIFTVVLVVHDDWCCYPDDDLNKLVYGRCDNRRAVVRHMTSFVVSCGRKSWTHSQIGCLIAAGVMFLAFVVVVGARMAIIARRMHLIALPRKDEVPEKVHGVLARARIYAQSVWHRLTSQETVYIYLYHRLRWIALLDPLSFTLAYPSIMMQLSGAHIVVQLVLLSIAYPTFVIYAMRMPGLAQTQWKYWLVSGCFTICGGLAVLHHLYLCARLFFWTHTCVKHAHAKLEQHAARNNATTHQAHHDALHTIITAVAKEFTP